MNTDTVVPTCHVLLIGIDSYPPDCNSLKGCVNDIDAIEQLLLEPPGIGIPAEFRVTRLAAPHPDASSTSRFVAQTQWPTKENVVAALKGLAGSDVKKSDRVLIYYSGHGDERQWTGSSVWHEALAPNDGQQVEDLFDFEVNTLVNAIAERTDDLTIVLDCCHSAGATRDLAGIQPAGRLRFLQHGTAQVEPPDLTALGPQEKTGAERGMTSGMLQSSTAPYLVVVACQADERAGEGADPPDQPTLGVFTHSLWSALTDKTASQRAQLRWADIWPELVAKTAERNVQLRQRTQHPWILGRSERRVFGGLWEKMDAGYRVTVRPDGEYTIGAGAVMGVTEGSEVAVYGSKPRFFPPLGSAEDRPVGRLRVTKAERSEAVAVTVSAAFVLPEGARGRLVKPGRSERLRVSLKPEGTPVPESLTKSPLLELVPATASDADVEAILQPDGSWIIGSDVEPILAKVPAGEDTALRAGLEHCYRYSAVLRFAKNCNDPRDSKCLSIRLLDCNDAAALQGMKPEQLADPDLPEAPRDDEGMYRLPSGFRFCFRVTNSSSYQLYVTLFNASAGGCIEYLSDGVLRDRLSDSDGVLRDVSDVMWLDGKLGEWFSAGLDMLPANVPGIARPDYATERVVAIGTTRSGVNLDHLRVEKRVQEVVEEQLRKMRGDGRRQPTAEEIEAPAEFWTATVMPIRIPRR